MKIIYLTDIHDGLRSMKEVFQRTSADLYILAGDIIYKAFFSSERIIDFCTIQEELVNHAKESGYDRLPYDYATTILRFPDKFDYEIGVKAGFYRLLFHKASKTMKEKYLLIKEVINQYANSPCLILPGNYDIDLQYTALYEWDIHRKTRVFGEYVFSGYGGAPIMTSGIPEKLAVKFHEYRRSGIEYSEPEEFFKSELPDVAIIHNPAYGILDKVPGYGNVGSQGIRRYVDDCSPPLVLSGHVHEDQGIVKKGKTVFLNPSNFGSVDSVYGFQPGGFLAEIYMENKEVTKVDLLQYLDGNLNVLMKTRTEGNSIELEYIDDNSSVPAVHFIRKI